MKDVLLARVAELAKREAWEDAVRRALADYLKVKPPRVSTLIKSLSRERMIRRKKVRLNGTGRRQTVFVPTDRGMNVATGIAIRPKEEE